MSDDVLREYRALVAKVDAFAAAVSGRRPADLQCRRGCAACCLVELSLSPVEAAALREALRDRPPGLPPSPPGAPPADTAAGPRGDACALLGPDGACLAYEGRPLVCRSQGLPLRYPEGLVPASAVRARGRGGRADGDLTWCPLNFTAAPPAPADVLDAGLVDEMLALVNRRFAERSGADPLTRTPLRALVAEALPA